ncbi:MAG: cytochrome c peroxidase [Planctomycetota bacterium]
MKTASVLSFGALALLFLQACGGDKPAAAANNPAPAAPAAQTPTAPTPTAPTPAAKTPTEQTPAAVPTEQPKKAFPRPRVDFEMAKRLFGNDPMAPEVDNPSTPEKVALGKALYHEKSLSKDGSQSCASCHDVATYGVDNKPMSPGAVRNTPTTLNAFREFAQFWDGRASTVEDSAAEHGVDQDQLVAKIKAKPELVAGFAKAFAGSADAVTVQNFKLAVGAFERSLVTKSRFDAYLDGDQKALGNEELLGLKLFMEGCITCHTGRLLGGHMFQKTGLLKPYPTEDTGRMQLTKSDADKFFFKVPQLLNVEKTGPYLHDGKLTTLEEVVKLMGEIQLAKVFKPEEVSALVAFLKSLTGPLPKV